MKYKEPIGNCKPLLVRPFREDSSGVVYQKVCTWVYDDNLDYWDTLCEKGWCFTEGTPKQNRMKFCPFCGDKLKQIK